ncbi:serine/threonine-protein kinase [Actinomadura rugatobispora]|uniref:non-specific serine/threonine protein kinase n=1 Tax=Actinomadura rugatobispora TaxID=1994 RepID=A0ABW0ZLK9_9ACTN|nr:serine/threonine-protein kinase [Actinomadura rugatobispora]
MSDGESDGKRVVAGRYRLIAVVGRGGMGTVWRAQDEMLDREVAVKEVLLRQDLSDQEREERHRRTLREARASARLNHPGVVTVHDVVDEDDRPWIVMELVRARSLQEIVDDGGPLPPGRVAGIGRQVVGALRAAHAIGILHRDVKPANVLITSEDRAVLTDFGIAQVAGDATLTRTGALVGSPAYMSPERVKGERAIPASDLWALGATLYAACEGKPPHHRSDAMAVLAAVMTQEPPPPRNAGPLAPVLYGLLRSDPVQRLRADQAEEMLRQVATGTAPAAHGSAPVGAVTAGAVSGGDAETLAPAADRTQGAPALVSDVRVPDYNSDIPVPDLPGPERTVHGTGGPGGGTGRRGKVLVPVMTGALIALVVVGVFGFVLWPDKESGGDAGPSPSAPVQSPPAQSAAPPQSGPATAAVSPPKDVLPALPQGFVRQRGPGFTIGVPAGWTRQVRGNSTFWLDPASDAYVQVDRTGWTGDPFQHWQQWQREVIAKRSLPGYRTIDLTRATVAGRPAADIEFAWNGTRAKDRGVIVDGRSYAVLVAVPASRWNTYQPTVNNVIDTFQP